MPKTASERRSEGMDWNATEGAVGVDLFGDPVKEAGAERTARKASGSNDRELAESVLRSALGEGYALIGHPMRVYRCVGRGEIETVPRYESEMVSDLIDRDVLKVGGWHDYTCGSSAGRGRSVLVPGASRNLLNRWAALKAPSRTDRSGGGGLASGGVASRRSWAGLREGQADGYSCVICAQNFRFRGAVKVPVGHSQATGAQVFACFGQCARQAVDEGGR